MRLLSITSATLLATATLLADDSFPTSNWKDAPDPLASPEASVGGSISTFAGQYPQSFNYYLANNSFCAELFSLMYETLLDMDPLTMEYTPSVASKWVISDEKLTFTFHLDPQAKWSDGKAGKRGKEREGDDESEGGKEVEKMERRQRHKMQEERVMWIGLSRMAKRGRRIWKATHARSRRK